VFLYPRDHSGGPCCTIGVPLRAKIFGRRQPQRARLANRASTRGYIFHPATTQGPRSSAGRPARDSRYIRGILYEQFAIGEAVNAFLGQLAFRTAGDVPGRKDCGRARMPRNAGPAT